MKKESHEGGEERKEEERKEGGGMREREKEKRESEKQRNMRSPRGNESMDHHRKVVALLFFSLDLEFDCHDDDNERCAAQHALSRLEKLLTRIRVLGSIESFLELLGSSKEAQHGKWRDHARLDPLEQVTPCAPNLSDFVGLLSRERALVSITQGVCVVGGHIRRALGRKNLPHFLRSEGRDGLILGL